MMSAIPLNPVDAGKLPPSAAFSDKLFGMTKSGWVIKNGFVCEYYSPIGIAGEALSIIDLYLSILDNPAITIFAIDKSLQSIKLRKEDK